MIELFLNFYKRHRRAVWALSAVFIAVVMFAAFRVTGRGEVQYFTADVNRGDIVQIVNATGSIDAVTRVEVGSQVSGKISDLRANFNSVVHADQVIARIDPAPFEARVLQAQADLASARANIRSLEADRAVAVANRNKAQAALREAELNLQRTTELLNQGITSTQQQESAQVTYETAQANLEAAVAQVSQIDAREDQSRAQIQQREAQLEQARLDLDHTIIRAPIDGTVIARSVDLGQTVAASFSAPTLFTIAQDLTKMLVYAKTDESDVGKIVEGAEVTFTVDSFPGETFHGKVHQVRMNATTVQNVVTYDTIIEFDNVDRRLLPGMTAYVTIPVGSIKDIIKLPNGALRYQPEISPEQLASLLEKYGLNDRPGPAAQGQHGASTGESGATPSEGNDSNGDRAAQMRERFRNMSPEERARLRQQFAERRRQQEGSRRKAPPKETWQRVWKLSSDNNLIPVDVKVGLTDYTFTALIEGEIAEGEQLVIGQTAGAGGNNSNSSLRRAMRRF